MATALEADGYVLASGTVQAASGAREADSGALRVTRRKGGERNGDGGGRESVGICFQSTPQKTAFRRRYLGYLTEEISEHRVQISNVRNVTGCCQCQAT